MTVAEFSLRRPITTIMVFVSMMAIGLVAAFRLPLEQFPEISFPFVGVQVPYPGSTPQEVERTIIRPIEEALSTLPGIGRMSSNAAADGGFVGIMLSDWDRDVEIAAAQARDRIDAVRGELPSDMQRFQMLKFSTADEPVLRARLASPRDLRGDYDLIDREIKQRLERLPGIARVDINGAAPNEVEIAVDPDRLTAHGLSLNDLAGQLAAVNFSVSAGEIDEGARRFRVQPVGELRNLDELRGLVLNRSGLRLSDVAEVWFKPSRLDVGRRLEGVPAVAFDIFKERNANLVQVSRTAMAELEQIGKEPALQGIQVHVIDDQGKNVTTSLLELAEAGAIGLVLSIAVLFFFLRHWPSTLMVTLAIPVCFVITLGFMYFFGQSLNILTLMGLLLAVGMLVDNAVVVVESIYQERERYPTEPVRASLIGTRHVAIALSAGTICHCIVFVPNLFGDTNQISVFMSQVAVTISVSLMASWLVAISLIPMISARLKTPPAALARTGIIPRMQDGYARLLHWTLEHRGKSILGILLIIVVSMIPATLTKFDMGEEDVGRRIELGIQWNGAYSLEQMESEVKRVEAWLDENREALQIRQIYSYFGEQGFGGLQIQLREEGGDLLGSRQVMEKIREELPKSARATIQFEDRGGPGGGGDGEESGATVSLIGDSSETLKEIAESIIPVMSQRKELRDVRVDIGDANTELSVSVDRERAAQFGFSATQVAQYVGVALRGQPLREFKRGDTEVPVWIRYAGADDFGIEDLSEFTLRAPDGKQIPLLSLVTVSTQPSATRITRLNQQTMLALKANLAEGHTNEDARKAMEEVLASATFPAGYRYTFEGAFRQNDESGQQMLFNTLIALVMIYVVMAAVFESLLFPAAIMSSVLFSIFGVFWLFWITGTTFTIMASIGILVLMGVVVNNGIVMVEHINNLRRKGMNRTDALVAGSRERLRPILMTMGTAILALIPLCFSTTQIGGGGPAYYPMARAIAGGLAFSTVVSLLFLPTIYALLDDIRSDTVKKIERARGAPAAATPVT
ncbi:MAG: efflux RND transporter permease subunit [Chiayiivirga sp.]|jgi:HAE1 family hydrophobic/amphiphilic exporter-1|uniref:efflux RND transporter permease subunit n=1 Tax=Chiayiivirga sp. TaxID=2041042 RepID=UPI0025C30556|nr:efflux RND transporter permease subunit [Chiayiivirga sp.]MCI1709835.1 efflux RND transporter permease subunit [Chiayiivirga sp.]MCI1729856.1 efflux RND transporter permease subunit [Chiayiivirga sp.]